MLENIDYQSIMRSVPDLYLIVSPDLTVVDASDAYLNATKVKREEVIGKHVLDAFAPDFTDSKSTSANNFLQSAHAILHNKTPHVMPIQKYTIPPSYAHNGEYEVRYWSPMTLPILDATDKVKYLLHCIEDVTELDKLQQVGNANSERFQLLIENITDYAVIMLDLEGMITTWSSGAEHIFGYKKNEALGKSIAMLYSPEFNNPQGEIEICKESGRYEHQAWRVHKNGSKFWALVIMMPIYIESSYEKKQELVGYAHIVRDVSHQKDLETVKREFVSVVNHELRTPLTSIFGAIRLLLNWDKQSSEKNHQLLAVANTNCDRLIQLINDILDIEQLTTHGAALNSQLVDLRALIDHAISINKSLSARYGIALLFIPLKQEVQINVDTIRLVQVISHLIANAIKFSPPGEKIQIKLKKQKKSVRILVINKGRGIPEDFKNKMFEQFSQADVSPTHTDNGTGLGLAISKEIVEQFGSELKFKSIPNKETTFYFDLPLA